MLNKLGRETWDENWQKFGARQKALKLSIRILPGPRSPTCVGSHSNEIPEKRSPKYFINLGGWMLFVTDEGGRSIIRERTLKLSFPRDLLQSIFGLFLN